jgi:hypothetical protein
VQQATKIEFSVNIQTRERLRIAELILLHGDKVIE